MTVAAIGLTRKYCDRFLLSLQSIENLLLDGYGKQNPHEAGMAIMKNGMQLNGSIIVGVRSLDSRERKELEEESNLKIANKRPLSRQRKYARPGSESGSRSGSRIEDSDTPAKSSISRFVDLVFGMLFPGCYYCHACSSVYFEGKPWYS